MTAKILMGNELSVTEGSGQDDSYYITMALTPNCDLDLQAHEASFQKFPPYRLNEVLGVTTKVWLRY